MISIRIPRRFVFTTVIALVFSTVVVGISPTAASATACTVSPTTYAALQSAFASSANGDVVCLGANMVGGTTTSLEVPVGRNLTLDLHGYDLTIDAPTLAGSAGIAVNLGSTLNITDSNRSMNSLHVTGGVGGAGIGGNLDTHTGTINISNVTIFATGGVSSASSEDGSGAGIGGAGDPATQTDTEGFSGGIITISGGAITAVGGEVLNDVGGAGAGIGGGGSALGETTSGSMWVYGGDGGNITINSSAIINAYGGDTAGRGGSGAGIGGGGSGVAASTANSTSRGGIGATLTVTNAVIETAVGGTSGEAGTGAGIGGGGGSSIRNVGNNNNSASSYGGPVGAITISNSSLDYISSGSNTANTEGGTGAGIGGGGAGSALTMSGFAYSVGGHSGLIIFNAVTLSTSRGALINSSSLYGGGGAGIGGGGGGLSSGYQEAISEGGSPGEITILDSLIGQAVGSPPTSSGSAGAGIGGGGAGSWASVSGVGSNISGSSGTVSISGGSTIFAQPGGVGGTINAQGIGVGGGSVPGSLPYYPGTVTAGASTLTTSRSTVSYATSGPVSNATFAGWAVTGFTSLQTSASVPLAFGASTSTATISTGVTASISYNSNQGTGALPSPTSYTTLAAPVTVALGTHLSREGYTFAGWNSEPLGTGTAYNAATTITPSNNLVLYAQWSTAPALASTGSPVGGGLSLAATLVVLGAWLLRFRSRSNSR